MQQGKQIKSRRTGEVIEQLERRTLLSASLDAGVLNIMGTPGADYVVINQVGTKLKVQVNGVMQRYAVAAVSKIYVDLGAGWDFFGMATSISTPTEAYGRAGNDTIIAGNGPDTVVGGRGSDLIQSYGSNSLVYGGKKGSRIVTKGDNVTIYGGAGNDTINSNNGLDSIDGGGGIDQINTGDALLAVPYSTAQYKGSAFIANVTGYDPNQIRLGYNYGNYDPNAGAGQTIYIVDAFTGANVLGDFKTFCTQFGLPQPVLGQNFLIVNASGFTPAIDAGWAGEINLDLQWAHAVAPGAKIVLVQADSDMNVDVTAAIQVAANLSEASGGGIVSMSFGIPGDFLPLDVNLEQAIFQGASHTTFLAASGDIGGTLSYPATSPNVTAVGGTNLFVNQDGVRDSEETAWIDGGGGLTANFPTPSYQTPIGLPSRGVPDVAYNAGQGVAVFLTTPQAGDKGWFSMEGTSAGSPQWAGIVARMNQARAASHKLPIGAGLNGLLYQLYNNGTAYFDPTAAAGTTGGFLDILAGSAGANPATVGYDLATGIGVPSVSTLVQQSVQTDSFFISGQFGFDGQFFLPLDETVPAGTAPTIPLASPQPRNGTGLLSGGDSVDLTFTTTPNKFQDPSGIEAGDSYSATLFRTGQPGDVQGRIYGTGSATINNVNDVGPASVTFALKFEGTWNKQADGSTNFYVSFTAYDPVTGQLIPKSGFQRSVTKGPYSGCWYGGSLNGTAF